METKTESIFLNYARAAEFLPATINAVGFDVLPVDHKHNKHRVHIKTFNLDLNERHSWVIIKYIVEQRNGIGAHFGPSLRNMFVSRRDKADRNLAWTQPLRNHAFPYGVPNMSAKDKTRVEQANCLYMHMCDSAIF